MYIPIGECGADSPSTVRPSTGCAELNLVCAWMMDQSIFSTRLHSSGDMPKGEAASVVGLL